MNLLHTLLFILVVGVISQKCVFNIRQIYNQTDVVNCLRSKPLSEDVKQKTITFLKQMLTSQSFYARYSPPGYSSSPPFVPWTISIDLPPILDQILSKSYSSDYDFHRDLHSAYYAYKDAHFRYTPPSCYEDFYAILPFRFLYDGDRLSIQGLPLDVIWSIEKYNSFFGESYQSYITWKVNKIDGNDAVTHIKNWATNVEGLYKDPQVRFNQALIQSFWFRNLANFDPPSPLTLEIVNPENSTDTQTITVPFGYGVSKARNGPDFLNQCLGGYERCQDCDMWSLLNLVTFHNYKPRQTETLNHPLRFSNPLIDYYTTKSSPVTAFLQIQGFFPGFTESDQRDWVESVKRAIKYTVDNNIDRVVLDMRGNPGGLGKLLAWFVHYLDPNTQWCPFVTTIYPHSSVNDPTPHFYPKINAYSVGDNDGTKCHGGEFSNFYESNTRSNVWNGIKQTYSSPIVARDPSLDFLKMDESAGKVWGPRNLFFLSDGRCGSACAIVHHLIAQTSARVVQVGGFDGSTPLVPGSFGGGAAWAYLFEWSYVRDLARSRNLNGFPMESQGSSYGLNIILSKHDGGDEWAEFQNYPPDLQVAEWDFDNLDKVYGKVAALFGSSQCSPWEVNPDSSCPGVVEHGIGGRPCVNGNFDRTSCELATCENGYHLWRSSCVKNPSLSIAPCFHADTEIIYKGSPLDLKSLGPSECVVPHSVQSIDGVRISTTCGGADLRLTNDHLVFVDEDDKLVLAKDLSIGQKLNSGKCEVTSVTPETELQIYYGLNCIESTVVANNIKVSTFGFYHHLPAMWMKYASKVIGLQQASYLGDNIAYLWYQLLEKLKMLKNTGRDASVDYHS